MRNIASQTRFNMNAYTIWRNKYVSNFTDPLSFKFLLLLCLISLNMTMQAHQTPVNDGKYTKKAEGA